MTDVIFTVIVFVVVIIIVLAFIGYAITTNKIIRDQEREITYLKNQLYCEHPKEPLCIVPDGRHPKFGGF